jgi:hypothetical protein
MQLSGVVANGVASVGTASMVVAAFDTMGNATDINLPQRLDVDSLSVMDPSRVASGIGAYPALPGTDFGQTYDWAALLTANSELQLQGGVFGFPNATSYAGCIPAGPNYTGIELAATRYATFAIIVPDGAASHATIVLERPGSAWGDTKSATCSVHVRAVDAAVGLDTCWLDASEPFDGVCAAANGAGCLLETPLNNGNACRVSITFGMAISGTLFVRVGVVGAISGAGFAGVNVDWCKRVFSDTSALY